MKSLKRKSLKRKSLNSEYNKQIKIENTKLIYRIIILELASAGFSFYNMYDTTGDVSDKAKAFIYTFLISSGISLSVSGILYGASIAYFRNKFKKLQTI